MVVVIDNYDSFTYNLVQRMGEIDSSIDVRVVRNDELTIAELQALAPTRLLISPGPCTPSEAGVSVEVVRAFAGRVPILGVCLGHQSIGQALGATIVRAPQLMHGKTDAISHDNQGLFAGLSMPFIATRYHSLVIDPWGKVVLDMGGEAPGLSFAEIEPERIAEVRRQLPSLANRRQIAN